MRASSASRRAIGSPGLPRPRRALSPRTTPPAGWRSRGGPRRRACATQAREAFERVLRIDPATATRTSPSATSSSRADGWPRRRAIAPAATSQFDGQWMTQAEHEAILAAAGGGIGGVAQPAGEWTRRSARRRRAPARRRLAPAPRKPSASDAEYADEGIPLWWGGGWVQDPASGRLVVQPGRPSRPPATHPPSSSAAEAAIPTAADARRDAQAAAARASRAPSTPRTPPN